MSKSTSATLYIPLKVYIDESYFLSRFSRNNISWMLVSFTESYLGSVAVASASAGFFGPRYLCTKTSVPPTVNISTTVLSKNV